MKIKPKLALLFIAIALLSNGCKKDNTLQLLGTYTGAVYYEYNGGVSNPMGPPSFTTYDQIARYSTISVYKSTGDTLIFLDGDKFNSYSGGNIYSGGSMGISNSITPMIPFDILMILTLFPLRVFIMIQYL